MIATVTETPEPTQGQLLSRAAERWIRSLQKLARVSVYFVSESSNNAPLRGDTKLCRLINTGTEGCAPCQMAHRELRRHTVATRAYRRMVCPNGLALFSVPVMNASTVFGSFEGGCVFTSRPDDAAFKKLCRHARVLGCPVEFAALHSAFRRTPVVHEEELHATIDLLQTVSESIAKAITLSVPEAPEDAPPQIIHARKHIEAHLSERLSLTSVARAASLSEDYFSKLFKRSTGLAFTDYLARARVERAKRLLRETRKRVSEIAYESGFESVPNFNRHFKRLTGGAPNMYRITQRPARSAPSDRSGYF